MVRLMLEALNLYAGLLQFNVIKSTYSSKTVLLKMQIGLSQGLT